MLEFDTPQAAVFQSLIARADQYKLVMMLSKTLKNIRSLSLAEINDNN